MSNFWQNVNEEVFSRGGKEFVTRMNTQYPSISDQDYEAIRRTLAEEALSGNLTNVSREEAYFLTAEIDLERAEELLAVV